jgi:hypothetical protein
MIGLLSLANPANTGFTENDDLAVYLFIALAVGWCLGVIVYAIYQCWRMK